MKSLAQMADELNRLTRRKLEIEASVRMVKLDTPLPIVRALKSEHAEVVGKIRRLERRLK